jgi:DNA-binding MarR family transcriptional regulator
VYYLIQGYGIYFILLCVFVSYMYEYFMNNFPLKKVTSNNEQEDFLELKGFYIEMLGCIERLHRLLLDVIKTELDNSHIDTINPVQALLLYNIGTSELTVGELKTRGYYLGSNVSYNLKKLVEMNFVSYEKSHIDRRSVRIKLTQSGEMIAKMVADLYTRHTQSVIRKKMIDIPAIEDICLVCKDFERFWLDNIRYGE